MSNDEICWAKSQLNVLKFHFFSATVVVVVRTKPRIHNFNYKGKKEEPTEQTKQEWKVSQQLMVERERERETKRSII